MRESVAIEIPFGKGKPVGMFLGAEMPSISVVKVDFWAHGGKIQLPARCERISGFFEEGH